MSPDRSRVRLAILGPGDVASRDYLPEFHRIADRAEIVAVCGRADERARATGARLGVPWFTDQAEMMASVDLDALVNLTPIPAHEATTIAALEAGLHVYSEKPLGASVEGAARLRDLASANGQVLVAAPSVLVFPQLRLASQMLADDAIGAIHTARGIGLGGVPPWQGYGSDPSPFFEPTAGPLVDLGVYPLHAITGLMGPARRVAAMSVRSREAFDIVEGPFAGARVPVQVDDAWTVMLDLGDERLATVEANFSALGTRASEVEFMGERGTIALSLLDVSVPVHVLDASGAWSSVQVETGRPEGGPDHILGVEHFVECIVDGTPPILSADHAIHVIEILEASARSASVGATMSLETTFERHGLGREARNIT